MNVSADQLVAAYRRWHVPFVERPGWRTRNTGRAFDPIGIVVHHDALNDQVTTERGLKVIEEGRPDLRGPLAANWDEDDGIVYLCSFGNANHGGRFAAEPVNRTRAGLPPRGNAGALGLIDDGPIANGLYYGDEVHNAGDGRDPYEPGQMQSLTLSLAARCELHGWTGARVIGHSEGTRRKIDPRGIYMAALRDAVDVCLFVGPGGAHPTPIPTLKSTPPPAPPVEEEDNDMQLPALIVKGDAKGDWFVTDCVTKQWINGKEHAAILIGQGKAKAEAGTGDMAKTADIKPWIWPQKAVDSIRLVGPKPG